LLILLTIKEFIAVSIYQKKWRCLMIEAKTTYPVKWKEIYAFTNNDPVNPYEEIIEIETGYSSSEEKSTTISDSDTITHGFSAGLARTVGLSKIISISASTSLSYTYKNEKRRERIRHIMNKKEFFKRMKRKKTIPVAPGSSCYLYQMGCEIGNEWIAFDKWYKSGSPIEDFEKSYLQLEGEPIPWIDNPEMLFHIISVYPTGEREKKLLAHYGDKSISPYMGDLWVKSAKKGSKEWQSSAWRFIKCSQFSSKDVYFIQNVESNKLLSMYSSTKKIYAGDPWVMETDESRDKLNSLWCVYPNLDRDDMYYISHFQKSKLLSWYEGHRIYAGDDWVIGKGETANFSSEWKIVKSN
jgi:hypothetical protein